jgi:opacity protein-like surface antigen
MRIALTATALALLSPPAFAQNGWDFSASLYGFLPETRTDIITPIGSVSTALSFKDSVGFLNSAFAASFEARNGRFGIIGDYLSFGLDASTETPRGVVFANAGLDMDWTTYSLYLAYRVQETSQTSFDLGIGARVIDVDFDINLTGGAARDRTIDRGNSDVYPLLAARINYAFSPDWSAMASLDGGTNGDGDNTLQAQFLVNYAVNENFMLQGGWRYFDANLNVRNTDIDISQSGPLIGVTYRF